MNEEMNDYYFNNGLLEVTENLQKQENHFLRGFRTSKDFLRVYNFIQDEEKQLHILESELNKYRVQLQDEKIKELEALKYRLEHFDELKEFEINNAIVKEMKKNSYIARKETLEQCKNDLHKADLQKLNKFFCEKHSIEYPTKEHPLFSLNDNYFFFECPLCLKEKHQERMKKPFIELCKKLKFDKIYLKNECLQPLEELKLTYNLDAKQEKALESAKDLLNGKIQNLMFIGNVGNGKSLLSHSVIGSFLWNHANEYKYNNFSINPFYIKEYDLENLFSKSSRYSEFSQSQLKEFFSTEKLLVIDEIGRSERKNASKNLESILDTRFSNGLQTILISNFSIQSFQKYFDGSIISRLTSFSNSSIIVFDNPDYRQSIKPTFN